MYYTEIQIPSNSMNNLSSVVINQLIICHTYIYEYASFMSICQKFFGMILI